MVSLEGFAECQDYRGCYSKDIGDVYIPAEAMDMLVKRGFAKQV